MPPGKAVKEDWLRIRVTETQRQSLHSHAREMGKTFSEWALEVLNERSAAEKVKLAEPPPEEDRMARLERVVDSLKDQIATLTKPDA